MLYCHCERSEAISKRDLRSISIGWVFKPRFLLRARMTRLSCLVTQFMDRRGFPTPHWVELKYTDRRGFLTSWINARKSMRDKNVPPIPCSWVTYKLSYGKRILVCFNCRHPIWNDHSRWSIFC